MSENPIFSYTKRDYERSRQEGLAKIPIISEGKWTDLNASDPGIIILDYLHALVDLINYYQDHQALETFISTAKERGNLFRLAKQLSYKVRSAKGATCDFRFTSSFHYNHPIKIPKYTKITVSPDITYLVAEDTYLPTNAVSVDVPAVQGTVYNTSYVGTGISRFSEIENAENQYVTLTASNIDIDTIEIYNNSTKKYWKEVDYIVFSDATAEVYQLELTPMNSVVIKFGDGVRGLVPSETDEFTITYLTTSAESGKIGANSKIDHVDSVYDNGNYVDLIVSNPRASIGGTSVQSSISIKENAPGVIKSQYRAVTLSDFEYLAETVEGVLKAKAYDINTAPDLCLHHEVKVVVTPEDIEGSKTSLIKRVANFLSSCMIPPTNLHVLTPSPKYIKLEISIQKLDNVVSSRLEYDVREAISKYFKEISTKVGEAFHPLDLASVISSIPGVRYVSSITPNEIVNISNLEVAALYVSTPEEVIQYPRVTIN